MKEILTDTALRQLTQMFLEIIFFYASEYILARAIHGPSINFGFTIILLGEILRKTAIITAGGSSTHLIKVRHE
ncbi:hypothetical protein BRARA_K00604 [Brassica rapa]|uniref:Protein-S-isoprenylcysteine O-methyltransferase n=1 Tax=Brassica campestris TaxID=3711 RepID=A0A397L320_BRACM|nr:hypothetical protein BRARA_K00604 [Brassica rapa]